MQGARRRRIGNTGTTINAATWCEDQRIMKVYYGIAHLRAIQFSVGAVRCAQWYSLLGCMSTALATRLVML